jgi:Domain of unknown function (DUF4832)/Domain of unknown function (DUF4874)/Secretion system C-terminal sorting domain
MKNKYYIMVLVCFFQIHFAQTTTNYSADNTTNFPNPERGFWIPEYPTYTPVSVPNLISNRENFGYTTMHFRYIIGNFKTTPLSQTFLDNFTNDLSKCRQAGVKMVPCFWYNEDQNGEDAAYNIVINHLNQLQPIVQNNADVIAYWGGGLIGAWGEWHTSSNNLVDNSCFANVNANTIGIHNKILEILPTTRMTVVRYPRQWFGLYGRQPISETEAFTGTNKARTGYRNHFFSGNLTDGASWMMPGNNCVFTTNTDTIAKLKLFVRNLCKYSVYEIEADTNLPITDPTYSGATALTNMAYQRVSTGNVIYNINMINRWKDENVFDEMSRRMGYRFRLIQSTFPNSILTSNSLPVNFVIRNDGFASPYNPRNVELVLRKQSNGAVTRILLNTDPRFWLPDNGDITISENITLPNTLETGNYDLLLNFPDPMPSINTRPEYAIRLANTGIWEANTGYNSLQRSIFINQVLSSNGGFIAENSIKLYPNPASDTATLDYYLAENMLVNIAIYDVLGKKVQNIINENQNSGNQSISIDTSLLNNGSYFVEIMCNNQKVYKTLLVK